MLACYGKIIKLLISHHSSFRVYLNAHVILESSSKEVPIFKPLNIYSKIDGDLKDSGFISLLHRASPFSVECRRLRATQW